MSEDKLRLLSASEQQTHDVGERLGRWLRQGDVVLLHGDLGAGKTRLAQGIARGLAVDSVVHSPTFGLVHEYDGRSGDGEPVRLYHLDLYRLAGPNELDSFGFDDYLPPADGISLIEWPERAVDRLPDRYLLVHLEHAGERQRRLTIEVVPHDAAHNARLEALRRDLDGPVQPADRDDRGEWSPDQRGPGHA
jgi:tRNA threonylcarbamoyladenosine biosynthesis protein TsaE